MTDSTVRAAVSKHKVRHDNSEVPINAIPVATEVLTLDGALPASYLSVGDRVITRDRGAVELQAIRLWHVRAPAIQVLPGALGHMRPDQVLMVPGTQQILLRDWRASALFGAPSALVPLSRLVDGAHIRDMGQKEMTLLEVCFDAPHIFYANGLELASSVTTVAHASS